MKPIISKVSNGVLAFLLAGLFACSTPQPRHFEPPPEKIASLPDGGLFSQALSAQKGGRYTSAIKLWNEYLATHPNSFEAHANLGLAYYTEDLLTQAINEFETAFRLEPQSEKVKQHWILALKLQATLFKENGDYDSALANLTKLLKIVKPNEMENIRFVMEKIEDTIFEQVKAVDSENAYQEYIDKYPEGLNAAEAKIRLKELKGQSSGHNPFTDNLSTN